MAGLALTAATAGAQVTLFTDDFESPDVTAAQSGSTGSGGTSKIADTNKWVRASVGFGSGANGIEDEGAGRFTDPVGQQAYRFCYTNSGVTTKEGVIGKLQLGVKYTVTFDVVRDGTAPGAGLPYSGLLLAAAPGATRNDFTGSGSGNTLLNSKSGNASNDGLYSTQSFTFTAGCAQAGIVGYDLVVGFAGATESANIDNVKVEADYSNLAFWNAGGATPSGIWTDTKWNPLPDGSGTDAVWTSGLIPVFSAGAAATSYTVTVDGTQSISGLIHEEGTLILANGTSGTLNLAANSHFIIASGLSATVGVPLTDSATQAFEKCGAGTLVLSADNSGATGPVSVSAGTLQVESASALSGGPGETVTLASGGTLALGTSFGVGSIPATLDRIVTTSAGTIAADNYAAEPFNFSTPGLTAAYLGAVGSVSYSGALTPQGTTYRLGGGGGTLTMANTDALTGATSAIIRGNVALAAANSHSGGTTLTGTNLTLGNNGSLGGGTFTISGTSTIQASATVAASNVISANADFTVAGSQALTLNGAMTINGNRVITNTNTTATTTFGAISRDGSNNRNLTVNGAGNTTISGNLVLGTGTLTKNNAGYLTLEGSNNYSGTTTINGGRLILKGSNSTAGATTLVLNQLHLASASNGGLPSGALTFGNGTQFNAAIQTMDDDRTISNNLVLNNTHGSIGGDYSLTVNGSFTNSAGNRTLTNSILAGESLTLAGQVNLSNDATSRTLTITGMGSTVISGQIVNGSTSTTGVLTKTGAGTLTLSNNTNSYKGATNISAGKLFINGDQTAATGNVNVTGTGVLGGTGIIGGTTSIANNCGLEFNLSTAPASHDKLELAAAKTLTFSGASVLTITSSSGATTGLYTLVTAPGASSISGSVPATVNLPLGWSADPPQIVADGPDTSLQINITSTGGGGPTYASWSGGAAANVDTNGDGVDNGVAWALGAADPSANAIGLLPTLDNTSDPTYVIFTFNRSDDAQADPSTTITAEYGNDLVGWTTAVDDNDNVEIEVTDSSPKDTVVVKLKRATLGSSGKLFARLNVVITP
jgi:autotransporter-associated beta strand protein